MSASTEPRSGLKYGWALGEDNWNTEMDNNLLMLGRVGIHLSVKDRDLTAPPGGPTAGDTYIPAPTATGAWVGWEGSVVVWSGSAWVRYQPRKGWLAFIEDEDKIAVYKTGTTWSAGVAI